MSTGLPSLPPSLRRYVAEQDYARYDAADQAVWRFVLLHLGRHLAHVAHPSYSEGLRRSALSAEAIPRIADMDAALGELGWGAVCVSGFIPPRAFQRFQALGVLPIAADIRTPEHVAYTPSPDIIHEAAGHAPILVNPEYGAYLRRSGEVSELAFSCPGDVRVTNAITTLSRVKESCPAGSPVIAAAEAELQAAIAGVRTVSEATRMSRLYWWTAEYGLIGTVSQFQLYGAGLLSSLGEAVYCLDPAVAKRPLDLACLDVAYDITRPQPQLFVTPSFEALFDVLEDASKTLAVAQGVTAAAQAARDSALGCQVRLSDGSQFHGRLVAYAIEPECAALDLETDGVPSRIIAGTPRAPFDPERLRRAASDGSELEFRFPRLTLSGRVLGVTRDGDAVRLQPSTWQGPGEPPPGECWVHLGARLESIVPADEDQEGPASGGIAPALRELGPSERRLRDLYDEAEAAWRERHGRSVVPVFERVHRALDDAYPHEWLLRWNLLENLLELGEKAHGDTLTQQLLLLEAHYAGREPIATGLASLRRRSQAENDTLEQAS